MTIFNSGSRFEAAQILKRDCLQELQLDDLHKLLEIIIMKKLIQFGGRQPKISVTEIIDGSSRL
ncbi:hypothetical protein L195_g050765 [Trifolium pratense]|uniref:Uncharacterized protein n=1 Tax=Trifolium pratense TaxID=57577 RepID=A0A2K3JVW3_TRIPR|nr:hypothetical protein L195_g050765 [Trifolium pratense]